jgi:hypothetical protein
MRNEHIIDNKVCSYNSLTRSLNASRHAARLEPENDPERLSVSKACLSMNFI